MFMHFCQNQLPSLIALAGTPRFLSGLMGATSCAVAEVDVCALFHYDDGFRPAGFATVSRGLEEATRLTAERYVSSLGVYDPMRRFLQAGERNAAPLTFHLAAEQIEHPAYREMNYTRTNTVERMSIAFHDECAWYSINFYRKQSTGRFRPAEKAVLTELAPLLSSLVLKHVALSGLSKVCTEDPPQVRISQRLHDRAAGLSLREREICALIVLGHTSEAIGLKLGISLNTVLTYRKRAYAKLCIGSQNELFRICLD